MSESREPLREPAEQQLSPVKDGPAVAVSENPSPPLPDAAGYADADLSPVKEMDHDGSPGANEPSLDEPAFTREEWIKAIHEEWQNGVRSPLQTGKLILAAERAGNSDPEFRKSFDFGPEVYSKLKSIAAKERFTDENLKRCPPYYSSQYELGHIPRPLFDQAIDSEEIHPAMTRREATRLRETLGSPPKKKGSRRNATGKQNQVAAAQRGRNQIVAETSPEEEAGTTAVAEAEISPEATAAKIAPEEEVVATIFARKKLKRDEVKNIITLLDAIPSSVSGVRVVKSSALEVHD